MQRLRQEVLGWRELPRQTGEPSIPRDTKGCQGGREITPGTPHKSKHAWNPEQTSQGALSTETAMAHPHLHNTRACHRLIDSMPCSSHKSKHDPNPARTALKQPFGRPYKLSCEWRCKAKGVKHDNLSVRRSGWRTCWGKHSQRTQP